VFVVLLLFRERRRAYFGNGKAEWARESCYSCLLTHKRGGKFWGTETEGLGDMGNGASCLGFNALAFFNLSASGLLSTLIGVRGMEFLPGKPDDKASNNTWESLGFWRLLVAIHFSAFLRLSGLRGLSDTDGGLSWQLRGHPLRLQGTPLG
jgi:hypothetical protein